MKLFSPDNPVFRFVSRIGDMFILSLFWLVTSLPIFTIGASTTALFDVCMRIVRERDTSVTKDYFKAFRNNFRQSTLIFLINVLLGAVIAADMYFWAHSDSEISTVMNAVSIGFAVLYCAELLFVFPTQAIFENKIKDTIRTAFLLSLKHWYITIGLLAGAAAIVYLCYTFPIAAYIYLLIGTGTFGLIYSLNFINIFKRYNKVIEEDMNGKKWDKDEAKRIKAEEKKEKLKKKKVIR